MMVIDAQNHVMEELPYIFGFTTVFLLLLVAWIFKSVLIPLRLIATVGCTLIVVFGFMVFVFQYICGFRGLYWIIFPCGAPILVGLTLDYDLFLLTRVVEIRRRGVEIPTAAELKSRQVVTTKRAVQIAVERTQPVIVRAGLIMSIAFASLIFSKLWLLREFGVMLVVGTLFHTFF